MSALQSFNNFLTSQGSNIEEEVKTIIPTNLIQDYNNALIPQEPQVYAVPQRSVETYNNILQPEEGTYRTSLGVSYTLDDLEQNAEFQERANRFMEQIDRDENIFEYLRDSDYSLSSAIWRSFEMEDWNDQAKSDYIYLRETFDKASVGGLKQGLQLAKDLTIDFLFDPINWVAVAFSPLTLAASKGTTELIKIATKQALSKQQKSKLTKSMLKDSKKWAGYTALEGAAWAGPHDYFLQKGDEILGLRESIDAAQVGVTTALGATLGSIMGGSLGLLTATSPLLKIKMAKFASGTRIRKHMNLKGKDPNEQANDLLDDWEVEDNSRGPQAKTKPKAKKEKKKSKYILSQEEKDQKELKKFLSPVEKVIAETVGKPTTQLQRVGRAFKRTGELLSLFRYDWMRKIFDTARRGVDRVSFGEMFSRLRGQWHTDLETALINIDRTGKTKKWGMNTFWLKRLDDTQNDHLFYLLTTRSGKKLREKGKAGELIMPYGKYKGSTITYDTVESANQIGKLLDNIQGEASKKGKLYGVPFERLLDKKAFLTNYFPHKLQHDLVAAGKETISVIDPDGSTRTILGFKDLLKTYGKTIKYKDAAGVWQKRVVPYAEPNINIAPSERVTVIDKFGKKVEGPLVEGLTVDEKAFNMANFEKQAEEQMRTKTSKYYTKNPTQKQIDDVAMDLKAERIVDDILAMKDDPLHSWEMEKLLGEKLGVSGRTGFLKERVFRYIPEEEMYRFIDTDVEGVLNDYITNAALLIRREQVFGRSAEQFVERHLRPAMYELELGGVSTEERKEIARRFMKMYTKIAGVEIATPFGKGKTRAVMDGLKVMQSMAHLPFATLSSITEPLIMLARVRTLDTPAATRDIGKALYKEGAKMAEKIKNGIKRQVGIKHKGTKDFADEYWLEAYKVGLALEQSIYDRLEGLYGEMVDTRLQKVTRAFFKTTLLTQWTAAVQLAAFTTGKRLIIENTKKLATGRDAWGRKLSQGRIERLTEELNDLNINEKKAIRWYNSSLDENGNFDMSIATYGRGEKQRLRAFYNNDYLMGANRFSREIILIPDITEANKPIWYSHPVGQIFAQFASYPTAFNNTILKRFASEIVKDVKGIPKGLMPVATPKIVATTALMTSVAMLTNIARSQGHSLQKPTAQVLTDAIDRWGGLGPGQYAYRFWENAQYGGGPLGSVAKAGSGPLVQDILDTILYRKGIVENLASNVPFYGWLPWEAKQALRREGKRVDKTLHMPFTPRPKPKATKPRSAAVYAEGGPVVTLDKLRIPDRDKMTGVPYHMQVGVLWQGKEDERAGFVEGGEAAIDEDVDEGIEEVYTLITKDLRKQAPIFIDDEPIDTYTKDELKNYAKGITEPVYRIIKKDTWQQNLEDFRDAEKIGVHMSTEMPSTTNDTVLEGYVRLVRPLDLSNIEVPFEGFDFVEEIQKNPELKNKIIDDSLLPNATAEELVDDLLFYHDLKKEAIKNYEDLPHLDKILNVVSSHKIREVFKDIGYDGIIYGDENLEPADQQMEELGLREEFFIGGTASRISRILLKKVISGGQTGVDELGLVVGKDLGLETGGTMPKGFKRRNLKGKDYNDPEFAKRYGLDEHANRGYLPRTYKNIEDSDATVIIALKDTETNKITRGSAATKAYAKKIGKPFIVNPSGKQLQKFLIKHKVEVLNVAGSTGDKLKTLPLSKKRTIRNILVEGFGGRAAKRKRKATKKKQAIAFDSNQHKPIQKGLDLGDDISLTDKEIRTKMKNNPKTLFVFSDNQTQGASKDLAGTSAIRARGLPNSTGIILKRNPGTRSQDYWNDFKRDFKGKKVFNGAAVGRHHEQMNDGIAEVMRKFVLEDYDNIHFASDLGDGASKNAVALNKVQTKFTNNGFQDKMKTLQRYTSDFIKNKGYVDEAGMADPLGAVSRELILKRDIAQVYGPEWIPTETQFIKDPSTGKVIAERLRARAKETGAKPLQRTKIGVGVTDRPRGATYKDLDTPPSEEYYAKSYEGEIEALAKRDPVPTDLEDLKEHVKRLRESDSPYDIELADELELNWLTDNPDKPFPDDWRRIKKPEGGLIEQVEVTAKRRPPRWLKVGQEFYNERVVEGEFLNEHGDPVKLKPKILEALRRVQAKIDVPLSLADTYRSPERSIKAREDWIAGGRKGPPQAGEKSFHGLGQAFDLNQEDPNMYVGNKPGIRRNEQLYKALQEEEILKQLPGEWWHWSAGEITN